MDESALGPSRRRRVFIYRIVSEAALSDCCLPIQGARRDTEDSHTGKSSDVTFLTGGGPQQVMWKHTQDSVGCVLDTKAPLGRACCHLTLAHTARGEPFREWEGSQRRERDVARQADPCFAGLEASGITLQSGGGVGARQWDWMFAKCVPRARHRAWLLVWSRSGSLHHIRSTVTSTLQMRELTLRQAQARVIRK